VTTRLAAAIRSSSAPSRFLDQLVPPPHADGARIAGVAVVIGVPLAFLPLRGALTVRHELNDDRR
jgi:hypothetical protein